MSRHISSVNKKKSDIKETVGLHAGGWEYRRRQTTPEATPVGSWVQS